MKIAIFTRTGFHHASFINRLQEEFEVACVVRESYPEMKKDNAIKSFLKKHGIGLTKDEIFLNRFYETHSAGFRYHPKLKEYLRAPFDIVEERKSTKYLSVRCSEINSPFIKDILEEIRPDIVAVLGSSIIKPDIISLPKIAMINIHTGLSPYYRGTWSFGWPIVNKEPEYIGVTLHHVNSGIDSGDIICQTRPVLDINDDLNTIFLKVVSEGIELAVKAVKEIIENGSIKSYKQPLDTGRLYLEKDFSAKTARRCLSNIEEGIIGKYIQKKDEFDSRVKLFGYIPLQIS